MGVTAPLCLLLAAGVARIAAAAPAPAGAGALEETRGSVTIDWGEGTVTARAGAAGDVRMPSADLARPGAERRARAAALGQLKDALATLPLGGGRTLPADAVDRALGRAETLDVQYQTNGGAVVRMRAHFGDWLPAPAPGGPTLALAEAPWPPRPRCGSRARRSSAARPAIAAVRRPRAATRSPSRSIATGTGFPRVTGAKRATRLKRRPRASGAAPTRISPRSSPARRS